MKPGRIGLLVAGLAVVLAGCGPVPPRLTPPSGPVPDLRGAWTGTWGGTPLTLFVLEQTEDAAASDVSVGPWALFGERLPGLSGVLTFVVEGKPISVNFRARLGDSNGRLTLVLDSLTTNGEQITLTQVDEHRMTGEGTSRPSWEPQGRIELVRRGVTRPGDERR